MIQVSSKCLTVIQIKLEIDTDPPLFHLPPESKLVKNPVPFYISTYAIVDLFAGKMHAALCRNWKKRIKGRDWYDVIWYIQSGVPVNLAHLRERITYQQISERGNLLSSLFFKREELKDD